MSLKKAAESVSGFTLIELLVIITILAVLIGTALPYFQSYIEESRISKAKADLEEIGKALAVYESREHAYNASDVSQLIGRYLNKSPIDPWGRPYLVATDAGIVYSCGPDRDPATQEDNLFYPYQPLLALVRATWLDDNKNSYPDGGDHLQLEFSRKLNLDISNITKPENFVFSFSNGPSSDVDWPNVATSADGQGLFLPLGPGAARLFTPGSDTIKVAENNDFYDTNKFQPNRCISSQTITIKGE